MTTAIVTITCPHCGGAVFGIVYGDDRDDDLAKSMRDGDLLLCSVDCEQKADCWKLRQPPPD